MLKWFRKKQGGVRDDENLPVLHAEFCRTFQHKPGVNFMEFLEREGVTRMIEWLRPETACAIPKGFVRLAVNSVRKGFNVWEMEGISMAYEGNWTEGGGLPPKESLDALSAIAQILAGPIKLYYAEFESGPQKMAEFVS